MTVAAALSVARRFAILSRGNTSATVRMSITTAGLVTIPGTLSATGPTTCGSLSATSLQVGTAGIGTITMGSSN